MTITRRAHCLLAAAVLLAATFGPAPASAQAWPEKPIKIIVPFPPGGSTDVAARQFANQLSINLGQPIVVENVGGANGTLGLQQLARAKPDGYTLAVASNGNMVINTLLYSKLPFNPLTDFTPVAMLVEYTNLLVVKADSPLHSISDLIAYAKENPTSVTYGSAGIGASNHLGGYILAKAAGFNATHVPYKGSGPAMVALLGGNLTFMFDVLSTSMPQIQAGKIRVLASAGITRNTQLPDVPLVADTVPGFTSGGWFGLFGPANMPPEITHRLNTEITKIIQNKEFANSLAKQGTDTVPSSPEHLHAVMVREQKQLESIMKDSGIKLD